jgi:UDP-N-acetylglucosamine--N-acetylmuramyl-(pentapeptide) pyrophosphoryl-undecaprenol N-acetylglucosamine transferase
MHNNKIFITSGGTGGHIIPARCLAAELTKENFQVLFLGDKKYRNYIKAEDSFKSLIIASSQFEKKPLKLIIAAVKIGFGALQSLFNLLIHRPKFVVSFGGYSTFPLLIAAVITKTKIILHEQNSHLGKVNRIFAKYADKIALSFVETTGINEKDQSKTVFVGNPVREEILELNKIPYSLPEEKTIEKKPDNKMGYDLLLASELNTYLQNPKDNRENLFNILVIGGSGGAKIFSEILPKAFFNLSDGFKGGINIIQQCREELMKSTYEQYRSFNLNGEIQAFFSDMPEKISQAHLVIARAGSSSLFEFCAAKKPMILVPFEKAADNHQEKNARFFEKNGAAIVITEKEFTINKISETLKKLIDSQAILKRMSDSAASLAKIDATKNLAKLVK